MTMQTPTKVWPLESGIKGFTAHGHPTTLQPGTPGFLDWDDAVQAEKDGKVDIMAGKTPQSLRAPVYETRQVKARPIAAPPEVEADPDWLEETAEAKPAKKPTPRRQVGRTRKKAPTKAET